MGICSNSQVGVPQNLNPQKGIVFSHKKSKCWVLKVGSFKVKGSLLQGFIQTSGVPKLGEKVGPQVDDGPLHKGGPPRRWVHL